MSQLNKIAFIIGVPRSGTTWLWGLLTSHPYVEPIVKYDFEPNSPHSINDSETAAFSRYSTEKIIEVFNTKRIEYPTKYLLEKTPIHSFVIKKILSIFPKAKFLHIIRDPKAVISSMLNTSFTTFASNIEEAVNKYRNYINAISPFLNDQRVHTLKYEDLKKKPQYEINKVLKFLHLSDEYSTIMIKENENKSKIPHIFRIGKIDSYKADLSESEIKYIEKNLFDIIRIYKSLS
ncbi:MAG: sulfotransferase family protein [Promethearchaeota archaeon]